MTFQDILPLKDPTSDRGNDADPVRSCCACFRDTTIMSPFYMLISNCTATMYHHHNTQFRLEDRTGVTKVNWIFHDNRSTNLYIMITKNKTLPTTTLYYKTCTKYLTVSIYSIALKYCLYINRRRSSLEAQKQFGSTF